MELMLDTANLDEIEQALKLYSVSGVTTNPAKITSDATEDFFGHLKGIRSLIGTSRSLHVQVVGDDADTMVAEGHRLRSLLGDNTFISIPVTEEGLKAIKHLASESIPVTATAVFSTMQGMLAMLGGARYVAVFYDRMLNNDIDAPRVIKELSGLLWTNASQCQVLASSFKNIAEVTSAFAHGAGCCTVRPQLLDTGLKMPSIEKAVRDFRANWSEVYGDRTILDF